MRVWEADGSMEGVVVVMPMSLVQRCLCAKYSGGSSVGDACF